MKQKAIEMECMVEDEISNIQVNTMNEVNPKISQSDNSCFELIHEPIISRIKSKMEEYINHDYLLEFCSALEEDGDKLALLKVTMIYGYCDYEDNSDTNKWYQSQLNVTTKLNSNTNLAMNPLYSMGCAEYIRKTWFTKVPLWSRAIVYLLEQVHGMSIEGNNQSSEGFISNYKHNTNVSTYTHDLGAYILFCDEFERKNNKYFIHQSKIVLNKIQESGVKVDKKRKVTELSQDEGKCKQKEWGKSSPSELAI